jgi:hypothetical protein
VSKSGPGPTVLVEALCQFVNFVIKGDVLEEARSFFFRATLIALSKPDSGVRPIAVGCTLKRLVAKCVSKSICAAMCKLLAPLQVGYRTPLGTEATAHAARTYLSCLQPDQLMLKIDFRNAFNTVRRDVILHRTGTQPICTLATMYWSHPKVCSKETLLVLSCSA